MGEKRLPKYDRILTLCRKNNLKNNLKNDFILYFRNYFIIMLVPSVQKMLHLRGAMAVNAMRSCSNFYARSSVADLAGI